MISHHGKLPPIWHPLVEKAVHVYGAWIRMIQKGSQRVGAARTGALSGLSCTCMKTTTQSGQAWRGYDCALSSKMLFLVKFDYNLKLTKAGQVNLLTDLGKRIERLLYLSIFIMAICWGFNYFAQTVLYTQKLNPNGYDALINGLNENIDYLNELFSNKNEVLDDPLDLMRVNKVREKLGLEKKESKKPEKRMSYENQLSIIAQDAVRASGINYDVLMGQIDSRKSPSDNIKSLEGQRSKINDMSINVWGIESPSKLLLSYGDSKYKVANNLITTTLLYLTPLLIIVWLSSFYMTRNREASLINDVSDYRITYPHILNLFFVAYDDMSRKNWELRFVNAKNKQASTQRMCRLYTLVRIMIITILLSLIFYPYVSGLKAMYSVSNHNANFIYVIHILSAIIMLIFSLSVLSIELMFTNKVFSGSLNGAKV